MFSVGGRWIPGDCLTLFEDGPHEAQREFGLLAIKNIKGGLW
jgi:hypothetical protein